MGGNKSAASRKRKQSNDNNNNNNNNSLQRNNLETTDNVSAHNRNEQNADSYSNEHDTYYSKGRSEKLRNSAPDTAIIDVELASSAESSETASPLARAAVAAYYNLDQAFATDHTSVSSTRNDIHNDDKYTSALQQPDSSLLATPVVTLQLATESSNHTETNDMSTHDETKAVIYSSIVVNTTALLDCKTTNSPQDTDTLSMNEEKVDTCTLQEKLVSNFLSGLKETTSNHQKDTPVDAGVVHANAFPVKLQNESIDLLSGLKETTIDVPVGAGVVHANASPVKLQNESIDFLSGIKEMTTNYQKDASADADLDHTNRLSDESQNESTDLLSGSKETTIKYQKDAAVDAGHDNTIALAEESQNESTAQHPTIPDFDLLSKETIVNATDTIVATADADVNMDALQACREQAEYMVDQTITKSFESIMLGHTSSLHIEGTGAITTGSVENHENILDSAKKECESDVCNLVSECVEKEVDANIEPIVDTKATPTETLADNLCVNDFDIRTNNSSEGLVLPSVIDQPKKALKVPEFIESPHHGNSNSGTPTIPKYDPPLALPLEFTQPKDVLRIEKGNKGTMDDSYTIFTDSNATFSSADQTNNDFTGQQDVCTLDDTDTHTTDLNNASRSQSKGKPRAKRTKKKRASRFSCHRKKRKTTHSITVENISVLTASEPIAEEFISAINLENDRLSASSANQLKEVQQILPGQFSYQETQTVVVLNDAANTINTSGINQATSHKEYNGITTDTSLTNVSYLVNTTDQGRDDSFDANGKSKISSQPNVSSVPPLSDEDLHISLCIPCKPKENLVLCDRWVHNIKSTVTSGTLNCNELINIVLRADKTIQLRASRWSGVLPCDINEMFFYLIHQRLIEVHARSLYKQTVRSANGDVAVAFRVVLPNPQRYFTIFGRDTQSVNDSTPSNKSRVSCSCRSCPECISTKYGWNLLQWVQYGIVPCEESQLMRPQEDGSQSDKTDPTNNASYRGLLCSSSPIPRSTYFPTKTTVIDKKIKPLLSKHDLQVLHWMENREVHGSSASEIDEYLAQLSKLVDTYTKNDQSIPFVSPVFDGSATSIKCRCGPIVVTAQAARESYSRRKMYMANSLWKTRYMARPDLESCYEFYVNESTKTARLDFPHTHGSTCKGGILCGFSAGNTQTLILSQIVAIPDDVPNHDDDLFTESEKEATEEKFSSVTLILTVESSIKDWKKRLTESSLKFSIVDLTGDDSSQCETINIDVALSSYEALVMSGETKDMSLFSQCFNRVVFDQSDEVLLDNGWYDACCRIKTRYAWIIRDKPINDLTTVVKMLKLVQCHFCLVEMVESIADKNCISTQVFTEIIKVLHPLIWHYKPKPTKLSNQTSIVYYGIDDEFVKIAFHPCEREIYNQLQRGIQNMFSQCLNTQLYANLYDKFEKLLRCLLLSCNHVCLAVSITTKVDRGFIRRALSAPRKDTLVKNFSTELLQKFGTVSPIIKAFQSSKSSQDFVSKIQYDRLMNDLNKIVSAVSGDTHMIEQHCVICLNQPKVLEAVLTPCGHIFCRRCVTSYIDDVIANNAVTVLNSASDEAIHCPCCSKRILTTTILTFNSDRKGMIVTKFLKEKSAKVRSQSTSSLGTINDILLKFVKLNLGSSKMQAVVKEVYKVKATLHRSNILVVSFSQDFLLRMQSCFTHDSSIQTQMTSGFSKMAYTAENTSSSQQNDGCEKSAVIFATMDTILDKTSNFDVCAQAVIFTDPCMFRDEKDQFLKMLKYRNATNTANTSSPLIVRTIVMSDSIEERMINWKGSCIDLSVEELRTHATQKKAVTKRIDMDDYRYLIDAKR